jgi:hypothetical protein
MLAASIIRAIDLMMEAVGTSETSINFYQTTRRNIQCHLHSLRVFENRVLGRKFGPKREEVTEGRRN